MRAMLIREMKYDPNHRRESIQDENQLTIFDEETWVN